MQSDDTTDRAAEAHDRSPRAFGHQPSKAGRRRGRYRAATDAAAQRGHGAAGHATVLYGRYGRSWWLFLALLPVPDLGLLGLLWSKRVGAVTYDLTHTYGPPAALGLVGVLTGSGLAVALALVWFAHIGMDRALGLGLQYPDGSGCTHLRAARGDRKGGGAWTV